MLLLWCDVCSAGEYAVQVTNTGSWRYVALWKPTTSTATSTSVYEFGVLRSVDGGCGCATTIRSLRASCTITSFNTNCKNPAVID